MTAEEVQQIVRHLESHGFKIASATLTEIRIALPLGTP
jgi:hypothetical protein